MLGQLCLAGLLLGGAAAVLWPLAASPAFGAVLAATGPLGRVATLVGAHGGNGKVGLLLTVLTVFGGGCKHHSIVDK